MPSTQLTKEDFVGLAAISKARKANAANMFAGTTLVWAKYAREKTAKSVLSDAKSLKSSVEKVRKGVASGSKTAAAMSNTGNLRPQILEFIKTAMDVQDLTTITDILQSTLLETLIGEMTPFLGVITSTAKAAGSWRAAVKNAADLYRADYYLQGVLPGDPSAAAAAVNTVIQRFLVANTVEAARNSVAAGAKIAGLFADLGTATTAAIGAASSAAKIIQELAILGQDYKDMRAGNTHLKAGTLSLEVFKDSPILGCYLLACSDTSMVTNFFIADIGLPGWQDRVESMKKNQLDPLIKNANKAIVSAHISLSGLKQNKGAVAEKGVMDKLKANVSHQFNRLVATSAVTAGKKA